MIKSLMNRLKKWQTLKDFHREWIMTLKSKHLPLLKTCLCSESAEPRLLSTQVGVLHNHMNTYFTALDLASNADVSQLLFPDFRNPIETPFLWLGDFHPYIFTNLLRSFFEQEEEDETAISSLSSVWTNRDSSLGHFVEQLECGLRLMVPAIGKRARDAQVALVQKLGSAWNNNNNNMEIEILDDFVEEMTCVFLDANRLRRSLLSDIMAVLTVHQAAFFLQALAQFYLRFSHPHA